VSQLLAPFGIPVGYAAVRTGLGRLSQPPPKGQLGPDLVSSIARHKRAENFVYERGPTAAETQLDELTARLAQIRESRGEIPLLPEPRPPKVNVENLGPAERIRLDHILATEPFARSADDVAFLKQHGLPVETRAPVLTETPTAARQIPKEGLELPSTRAEEPRPLGPEDISAKYEGALKSGPFSGGRSETLYEALTTNPFERNAEHRLALQDAGLPPDVPLTRVRPPEGQVYQAAKTEPRIEAVETRQNIDDLLQRQAAGEILSQEEMNRLYSAADYVPLWEKDVAKASRLGTIIDPKAQPEEANAIKSLQTKPDEKAVETLLTSPTYSHVNRLAAMAPAALAGLEPAQDSEGNYYLTFDTERAAAALVAAGGIGLGAGLTSRTPRGGRFMREVPGGIPKKPVMQLARKHLPAMQTARKITAEWDGGNNIEDVLLIADNIKPILPVLSDEVGKLRWKVPPGKLPGNEKMQYPNEIFPEGRNTYEKAGCGRTVFIEQNGLGGLSNKVTGTGANAACYGGACYAEAQAHKYGGSVASGVSKRPLAGSSREAVKKVVEEKGIEEAQKTFPEYDIKKKYVVTTVEPNGQIKKVAVYDNPAAAEQHAMRLGGVATEDISVAKTNQNPSPVVYRVYEDAKGQDIRLGVDTDGGAFLAYKESMDGLLAANPRSVSVYASAYTPPPEPHPLSERTIVNVTISGYHPLPETLWRLKWAEKARENGWNVVLRFVTANPGQITKEEAKLYNRILPLLQDSDFFIMEQPLHRGSLYSEPMFFPACCQSKVRFRTCDSCEVVEGLGSGFRKFWGIPVEDLEEAMPEVFKKLSHNPTFYANPLDPRLVKEAGAFFKDLYSRYIGEPAWAFVKSHPAQVAAGAYTTLRTYGELPEDWGTTEKLAVSLLTGAAAGAGMHGITKIPAVKAFGRRAFGTGLPERYRELKQLRIPHEVMLLGQVRDLAEDLAKLPPAARQWLYDVRTGRISANAQDILAKVGNAGQRVHEQITRMTQMLVDIGALNPETARKNIDNYLHLSYQKYYDQPKLLRAMRKIRAIGDELKPRGIIKEIARDRLPAWEARGWEFFVETNKWGPGGEKLVRIRRQLTP